MNTITVKVGLMPGKLVELVVEKGITARQLFELAEVQITDGHEVRLDGNKINISDAIHNGNLLVGMKQIKGNR